MFRYQTYQSDPSNSLRRITKQNPGLDFGNKLNPKLLNPSQFELSISLYLCSLRVTTGNDWENKLIRAKIKALKHLARFLYYLSLLDIQHLFLSLSRLGKCSNCTD